jgi:release factor glutamine methyltransferase
MSTVAHWLSQARQRGIERLDAQRVLCEVLARPRAWLLAHEDAQSTPEEAHRLETLFDRLAGGEPLAYLLGFQEFHGLRLEVSPAVLVPRADTETLVDWALELLHEVEAATVLDMGTGSGAIALAIKSACPRAAVRALDASAEALQVARANAAQLGLAVDFVLSDWWDALPPSRYDLIVSNPPYIAGEDPHLAALQHEPLLALTPGGDGLEGIRRIVAGAPGHLSPGGWLLFEHGHDQADFVTEFLKAAGFDAVGTRLDLAGHTRCTGGRWP